ncbi:MAG: TonB-dependent receptor, partial [Deltaproteobacteria bacterium]|nr:TonB-dependent receptor [Deltaproteobacteria bacterium]
GLLDLVALLAAVTWTSAAHAHDPPPGSRPPHLRSEPPVPYPPGSRGLAHVMLVIVVDRDGHVIDATVTGSDRVGDDAEPFVAAATAYVRRLHFEPAQVGGRPVVARVRFVVHFVPPSAEPAPPQRVDRPRAAPVVRPAAPLPEPRREPTGVFESLTSDRRERRRAAASDFEIRPGALRAVPRRSAESLLTLAPGVHLDNHSGEYHASQIFLRGFDADEGQDLEVRVDGMPINDLSNAHGHGYADTHWVIPELVDSLRVTEGPYDPRQGDFAVAGSVDYRLGLDRRGLFVHGAYGSFRARRLAVLWGPSGTDERTFAGVDLRAGDGFGPNRAYSGGAAMAQWASRVGPVDVALLGFAHAASFDSAGVVREDDLRARRLPCAPDAESQRLCTYDPSQGGATSRAGASARLAWRRGASTLRQGMFAFWRDTRFVDDFTGYLLDAPPPGVGQRGDALEQRYDAVTLGLRGSWQTEHDWLSRRHVLELGYDARLDDGTTVARRLRREGAVPYATVFDAELRVTRIAVFGAGELRILPRLTLRGGLRADVFAFHVLDRARGTMDRDGERLPEQAVSAIGMAVSPRGTVDLAVLPWLSWVTSAGLGTRSSDATALSEGERAPFTEVVSVDTGVVLDVRPRRAALRLDARLAGFVTHVTHDLVFDPVNGRNVDVGASNRFGVLASVRARSGSWLDAQGSLTYADAYQPPDDAGPFDLAAGPRLPFVPRWVGRLDLALRHPVRGLGQRFVARAALGATYVGPRPLPLSELSDDVLVLDASAGLAWRFVELGLVITNLLDARYNQTELHYVSNFRGPDAPPSLAAERHVAAGPPLTMMGTVTFAFGTEASR